MKCSSESICIVLPAYNEEGTIGATVRDFRKYFPQSSIAVIDNCSSDKTYDVIFDLMQGDSRLKYFYEPFKGKSNAVRRAFLELNSEYFLLADADLTYPASEAKKLIDVMNQNGSDMVVGDRISGGHYDNENKRLFHSFGNRLVRFLLRAFFGIHSKDPLSGYRLLSSRFVKTYPILVTGFELETDLAIHANVNKLRVTEIPINYQDRPVGSESKLNTFSDGYRIIILMVGMFAKYRPLIFFSILSLPIFLTGLSFGIVVIEEFLGTGKILKLPSALLAVSSVLLSVLIILFGLVISVRNHMENRLQQLFMLNTNTD